MRNVPAPPLAENPAEELQANQRDDGRGDADGVHARGNRHANAGRNPDAGGRGETMYRPSVHDDGAGPEKADAADDLRRDPARVEFHRPLRVGEGKITETVLGNHHDERASERDEEMGAQSRLLGAVGAVDTDDAAQNSREREPADQFKKFPVHDFPLFA